MTPEHRDLFLAAPVAMLVIRADDLVMVEANAAYLGVVGRTRDEVVGRRVFDVFPDSALRDDDQATGLRAVLERAVATRQPVAVPEYRYDIPRAGGDGFDVRWWSFSETPLLDAAGEVSLLLHVTEDLTELRLARDALAEAARSERVAAARLASVAEVALTLARAETLADVEAAVTAVGLQVLGAGGGALATRAPGGGWQVTASALDTPELRARYALLPDDSDLPLPTAARTGTRVLVRTREEGIAFSPGVAEACAITGRVALACLPLVSQGRVLGAVHVSWDEAHDFTDSELELLEGVAAQCATAVDRIEQAERRRRTAEQISTLAEALQSAMVTSLPTLDGVDLAVRYRTASDVARVGGDWYDAFVQPQGDLVVVIGDVAGHDDVAAGRMGQVRGLLRGLAYDDRLTVPDSPADVLTRLERVSRGLRSDQLSTAVLVRVGTPYADGHRPVVWSNAGNPPPALLRADGTVVLLEGERADLILGVDPSTPRTNLTTDLDPGDTLLLYTDGLVERREVSLDRGFDELREALAAQVGTGPEELCDAVLERLDPHRGDDDVAMVAVHVRA